MAWVFQENRLGQSRVGDVDTEAAVPLGTTLKAYDPTYGVGEFVYLAGVASTEYGTAVVYLPDDFATARTAANAKGPVAVATAATVASTYGWYQVKGKGVVKVAASFADGGDLYITSTAGTLDDAVVAGDRVHGMWGASAIGTPSAGLAEVEMNYPYVDDIAD